MEIQSNGWASGSRLLEHPRDSYGNMGSQAATVDPVAVTCATTKDFREWFAVADGAIAVSTYQAGKVAMIGWNNRQVTLTMRDFDKPLGLTASDNRIILATRHDLWITANSQPLAYDYIEDQPGRYDAIYLPRATYHTGDLHTHDVAVIDDEIWAVATRFSCLAKLSYDFSFRPVWKPRFISDIVPEDRCHLNGLAVRDGRPQYVTALGTTDEAGTWRERKADGGVLIDIESGEIVLDGLSMPHSPRWHDGKLWLLNSGTGELLQADERTGRAEAVCGLPGYLRGLSFHGPYALIGMSKIRERHIFGGLPVQEKYDSLMCGIAVVDIRDGSRKGFFEFTAGCEEIYDVQYLPGVRRPTILNLDRPDARQAVTNPESCFWLRPSNVLNGQVATT